jgi:hypothetical protein
VLTKFQSQLVALAAAGVFAATVFSAETLFGVQDQSIADAIGRVNVISGLRARGDVTALLKRLEADLKAFESDSYALARIHAELADAYSTLSIDAEKAILHDRRAEQALQHRAAPRATFVPTAMVARGRILADKAYLGAYITISDDELRSEVAERLARNSRLVRGELSGVRSDWTVPWLSAFYATVAADIKNTVKGSSERSKLLSRLMRADFELSRVSPAHLLSAYRGIETGEISTDQIDFSEIDFLTFAAYMSAVAKQTGEMRFARIALETVYLPYLKLSSSEYRWRFSKIINQYLDDLIEIALQSKLYEDAFFFASLNKSRLLLEERIALSRMGHSREARTNDVPSDGIPRDRFGLPDQNWFLRKLRDTKSHLDFYVAGSFQKGGPPTAGGESHEAAGTLMSARDFGVEESTLTTDFFVDRSLLRFSIEGGRVASVLRFDGSRLSSLREQLHATRNEIVAAKRVVDVKLSADMAALFGQRRSVTVTISLDKWLSTLPIELYLGDDVSRTVNFFTLAEPRLLADLRTTGFFNPTADLPGADQEAEIVARLIVSAAVYQRETATIASLRNAVATSLVHLSMHGAFNAQRPTDSKLLFAGARKMLDGADPHALYVREMNGYAILRDRDLVFAATCQSGLTAADGVNSGELQGVLRALTANRNRNVILSLWRVDDTATRDFVEIFYSGLRETHDVDSAFHRARKILRAKYPAPYYWAAFYLSRSTGGSAQ